MTIKAPEECLRAEPSTARQSGRGRLVDKISVGSFAHSQLYEYSKQS